MKYKFTDAAPGNRAHLTPGQIKEAGEKVLADQKAAETKQEAAKPATEKKAEPK